MKYANGIGSLEPTTLNMNGTDEILLCQIPFIHWVDLQHTATHIFKCLIVNDGMFDWTLPISISQHTPPPHDPEGHVFPPLHSGSVQLGSLFSRQVEAAKSFPV